MMVNISPTFPELTFFEDKDGNALSVYDAIEAGHTLVVTAGVKVIGTMTVTSVDDQGVYAKMSLDDPSMFGKIDSMIMDSEGNLLTPTCALEEGYATRES